MAERLSLLGNLGIARDRELADRAHFHALAEDGHPGIAVRGCGRFVHLATVDARGQAPCLLRETKGVPVAELLERRIERQVTKRPAELRAIEGLQVGLGADSQAAVRDPEELARS